METIDLGAKLIELRTELGFSQAMFADIMGLKPVTYLHYEKNQRRPTLEQLAAFARYYDVTVDELLSVRRQSE